MSSVIRCHQVSDMFWSCLRSGQIHLLSLRVVCVCLTPKALCFTSKARPFEVLKQESFNFQVVFKASSLLELVVGHVLKPRVPTFSSFLILSSSFLFCGEWNEGVVIYYLLLNGVFLSSRWSVPISHSSFAFLWFSRKYVMMLATKTLINEWTSWKNDIQLFAFIQATPQCPQWNSNFYKLLPCSCSSVGPEFSSCFCISVLCDILIYSHGFNKPLWLVFETVLNKLK